LGIFLPQMTQMSLMPGTLFRVTIIDDDQGVNILVSA
jgi:hypothetical protein